jgi:hypothetical protein
LQITSLKPNLGAPIIDYNLARHAGIDIDYNLARHAGIERKP